MNRWIGAMVLLVMATTPGYVACQAKPDVDDPSPGKPDHSAQTETDPAKRLYAQFSEGGYQIGAATDALVRVREAALPESKSTTGDPHEAWLDLLDGADSTGSQLADLDDTPTESDVKTDFAKWDDIRLDRLKTLNEIREDMLSVVGNADRDLPHAEATKALHEAAECIDDAIQSLGGEIQDP